jgi:hypothetical protein
MKTRLIIPIAAALLLTGMTASALDFIRQFQVLGGNPVVIDLSVNSDAGEVLSDTLVAEVSVFQLWATHTKPDKSIDIIKLDEKSVGTFLPNVTITTSSEDPHVPTCTRADRPYTVHMTVSGMRSGETDPMYSKAVAIRREFQLYSPETYAPTGVVGEYADSSVIRSNGTYVDSAVIQRLPVEQPTQAVGMERFSAHMMPEAGVNLGQIAAAEVTIWPVAAAEIIGIEAGTTYKMMPPKDAMVMLRDAYPRSTTYAQIYKGPQTLGTEGEVIPGSVRKFGTVEGMTAVPQSTAISLGNLSSLTPESGEYTIEVLTITPFNGGAPERLAHISFNIDRTLTMNSMFVGME